MTRTLLDKNAFSEQYQKYPYVYFRELSQMYLGKSENAPEIHWDELLEARFFGADSELRLIDAGGTWIAALISDADGEVNYQDTEYILSQFGSRIAYRRYYGYDVDGQFYISAVRMLSWKE